MDSFQLSLYFAVPFFFGLILLEVIAVAITKRDYYANKSDVITSLSSGIATGIIRTTGFGFAIISYDFMLKHVAVFNFVDIKDPLAWLLCFIALDFGYYWSHRWKHKFNFLWQFHLIHHSSEEYNLPVALRQNIYGGINLLSFLLLPAAVLGIPTDMLAIISIVFLYAQYWYHTRFFGKLGWLEYVLVTPSIHRVHHAINKEYIDKNFSAIFSIWDRLFGTFQAELEDQETLYGVKHPVRTLNPIKIDFMYWWNMLSNSLRTKSISDKVKIWFKETGWRPTDLLPEYKAGNINDIHTYQKYNPAVSTGVMTWGMVEFAATLLLFISVVVQIPHISFGQHVAGVLFVLLQIIVMTTALEGQRNLLLPGLRLLAAVSLVAWQGAWFGLNTTMTAVVIGYCGLGLVFSWYFYHKETPMIPAT